MAPCTVAHLPQSTAKLPAEKQEIGALHNELMCRLGIIGEGICDVQLRSARKSRAEVRPQQFRLVSSPPQQLSHSDLYWESSSSIGSRPSSAGGIQRGRAQHMLTPPARQTLERCRSAGLLRPRPAAGKLRRVVGGSGGSLTRPIAALSHGDRPREARPGTYNLQETFAPMSAAESRSGTPTDRAGKSKALPSGPRQQGSFSDTVEEWPASAEVRDESDVGLLCMIIADTKDTPEVLGKLASSVREKLRRSGDSLQHRVHLLHSMVIVLERKQLLMADLIRRTQAYEGALAKREEHLRAAAVGDVPMEKLVGDALDFGRYVRRCVQGKVPKALDGGRVENLCMFFRLPGQHAAVLRAKKLLTEHEDQWASAVLSLAQAEVDDMQTWQQSQGAAGQGVEFHSSSEPWLGIQRMIDLATCLGLSRDHPQLKKAREVAIETHQVAFEQASAAVRECARDDSHRSHAWFQRALAAATRVEEVVRSARTLGVVNAELVSAERMAKDLRDAALDWMMRQHDGGEGNGGCNANPDAGAAGATMLPPPSPPSTVSLPELSSMVATVYD